MLIAQSCLTLLWPHGLLPIRHFLLQGIFPTQGSKPGLLHFRRILYHLRHQGSRKVSGGEYYKASNAKLRTLDFALYRTVSHWRFLSREWQDDFSRRLFDNLDYFMIKNCFLPKIPYQHGLSSLSHSYAGVPEARIYCHWML